MTSFRIANAARADADGIADYYVTVAGKAVALGFADALSGALSFVQISPDAGSPRRRDVCHRPDLRVWPVKGHPYLVIYSRQPGQVMVLRILHAARDIPASLREPG